MTTELKEHLRPDYVGSVKRMIFTDEKVSAVYSNEYAELYEWLEENYEYFWFPEDPSCRGHLVVEVLEPYDATD